MAVTTHPDGSRTSPNWDSDEGPIEGDDKRYPPRGMSREKWEAEKRKAKAKTKSKDGRSYKRGGLVRGAGVCKRGIRKAKLY